MRGTDRRNIVLFVLLPFVFSFSLLSFLITRMQAENASRRVRDAKEDHARLISGMIRESMRVGHPSLAAHVIEHARKNGNGVIAIHTGGDHRRPGFDPAAAAAIQKVIDRGIPLSETRGDRFLYFAPLPNEGECKACHKGKGPVGVVSIDDSVAGELAFQKTTKLTLVFYAVASIGFGILTIFMVYEHYVSRPSRVIAAELSAQLRLLETVLDSINSGIIFVDRTGRVLKINPYALRSIGATQEESVGRPLDSLVDGLYNEVAANPMGEKRFTSKSGALVDIGYRVTAIREPSDLQGKIVHFKDLTEISALKAQVKRKEYFATIGEMASWIAHEIRNPVFGISSTAEILRKKCDDPVMKHFIDSMMKECSRIDELIDDLLRYVKPIRLDLRDVDISATVREVAALYDAAAGANGCRLEVLASGAVPRVTADPDKIKQVLMNIIKNAIEAKAKTVTLSVAAREDRVVARIADDGTGIAGKHLGSIFRPFFTTKKAGTGLGLPICMKIVEEHGGTLTLESLEGAGTTVELALK